MPRVIKHLLVAFVVVLIAGCSGGGCTSCAGITPLPGGFDPNARIENAGSLRLTDSGLQFLQANVGVLAKGLLGGMGGAITFPINEQNGGSFPAEYDICPGGPDPATNKCIAQIDLPNAALTITTSGPNDVLVKGTIPILLSNLPIDFKLIGIPGSATAVLSGNNACPGNNQTYDDFPLDVDVAVHVDTNMAHTARYGYSKIEIKQLVNDTDAQDNIKNHLTFCGGIGASILNLVEPLIIGQLYNGLIGTLKTQIDSQLCLKSNPALMPACPNGTNDVNGTCRYGSQDTDECVSMIIGTDGHIDLGSFLASLSPGTKGGLDFVLAAGGPDQRDDNTGLWGDLDPINNGATLGMFGGAQPSPLSKCVKTSEIALPTGIPIPDELFANTVPNWPMGTPGPHLGIALSERYTNFALNSAYNSGVLCLGVSTESIPLLASGTLGLFIPSVKTLAIQQSSQQVALVVRPSTPPSLVFGNGTDLATDPNLRVTLKQASFDFYIFSLDRFIRFMTGTFDLDIPVNLTVTPMGLTPVIDKIGVANGVVTNSSLLAEDPAKLSDALATLIKGQVGQALGNGIKPINLNSALASLGVELIIPDSVMGQGSPGLRKLTKGTDNYLGIFGALQVAGMPAVQSKTSAVLVDKRIERGGLSLSDGELGPAPVIRIKASSQLDNGSRGVEYAFKVDKGAWHPYTTERILDVSDEYLRLQGKHQISVRSRVIGEPMSLDPDPATVDFNIDATAPKISIGALDIDGKLSLHVRDEVSGPEQTLVRFKLDGAEWSAWQPASSVETVAAGDAAEIAVEATDEDGNIGTAQEALIRGRPPQDLMGGCGCTVVGGGETPVGLLAMLGIAIAGIGARLRRRTAKVVAPVAMVGLAGSFAGCSCGTDAQEAVASSASSSTGSGMNCDPKDTEHCTTLDPGLIGAYTSVAIAGDTIWMAGYAEANWVSISDFSYGDLVAGKWNGTKVDWGFVDGVPTDPPVDPTMFNTAGFRGGQTSSGDDVGIWTSIGIDGQGNPAVAYFDRTHTALKFARFDGKTWTASVIEQKDASDIGRYAKLLAMNGGWTVAYLDIEPGGDMGAAISKVRIASTTKANPGKADWTFEDVVVDKTTPCRVQLCTGGAVCLASTKRCVPALADAKCMPSCASGNACVDQAGTPTCSPVFDANKLDAYPDAVGDYITVAPDNKGGIGIAYYDRMNGNLMIAAKTGGTWKTTVLDGFSVSGGDVGIGASLFIDTAGDWHISYVDGYTEALKYVRVSGGAPMAIEIVDDGLGLGGMPFDDGQHLVGDDSSIFVTSSGDVHISYQDSTAGKLHHAVGMPGSGMHTWTVKAIDQTGFAGAFSHVLQVGGKLQIANWWRTGGADVPKGDVAIVTP